MAEGYDPKVSGPWSDIDDYPPGDPNYGQAPQQEEQAEQPKPAATGGNRRSAAKKT